ncbi:Ig-like domain-containing protein [Streptomyces sp. NPDC001393]
MAILWSICQRAGTPTGSVTFSDGTATPATVPLNDGWATFTTSAFQPGAHRITVGYNGRPRLHGRRHGRAYRPHRRLQPAVRHGPRRPADRGRRPVAVHRPRRYAERPGGGAARWSTGSVGSGDQRPDDLGRRPRRHHGLRGQRLQGSADPPRQHRRP